MAIEYEWDLKRKFWFGFADIQLLPPVYKHLCWFMNGMNMLVGKEWSVGYFESDHTHQQLQALGLLELAQNGYCKNPI